MYTIGFQIHYMFFLGVIPASKIINKPGFISSWWCRRSLGGGRLVVSGAPGDVGGLAVNFPSMVFLRK